jgi:hypothetical protein
MCQPHWDQLREAIQAKGMFHLVARSGQEAIARIGAELNNQPTAHDPLISCNFMILSKAVEVGGLYLMGKSPDGGEYCPLCELVANSGEDEYRSRCTCPGGFRDAATCWIDGSTDSEMEHCRSLGLELKPYESIVVRYSCVCGLTAVECRVAARDSNEDIKQWMDRTAASLSVDHNKRSPNCHPTTLKDIMIPIEGADHIGGMPSST